MCKLLSQVIGKIDFWVDLMELVNTPTLLL